MTTPVAADFYWKRNDTAPAIVCVLRNSAGGPFDLTTMTQVKFIMSATVGGSTVIDSTAVTVVGAPTAGTVSYQPMTGDTAAAGTFFAEWEVTLASGNKESFPDPGYLTILITADLDNA